MVANWTFEDVGRWLDQNNFSQYKKLLCDEYKIDGKTLLSLTVSDLWKHLAEISTTWDFKRFEICIQQLKEDHTRFQKKILITCNEEPIYLSNNYIENLTDVVSQDEPDLERLDYKHEIKLFLISLLTMIITIIVSSAITVLANHRVPDRKKYAPLPDIIMDFVPYMPEMGFIPEYIMMSLGLFSLYMLVLHHYRLLILRRFAIIYCVIMFFRNICLLMTALSIPSLYTVCEKRELHSVFELITRTFHVANRLGLSSAGVQNCGDFMFSGHTVLLTLLCLSLREGLPSCRYRWIHVLTWVCHIGGMFAIVLAQKHYTIDVFIGLLITVAVFHHYHNVLMLKLLMGDMADRQWRMWFPLQRLTEGYNRRVYLNRPSFIRPSFIRLPVLSVLFMVMFNFSRRRVMTMIGGCVRMIIKTNRSKGGRPTVIV